MKQSKLAKTLAPVLVASLVAGCSLSGEDTPEEKAQTLRLQGPRLMVDDPLLTGFTATTGIQVQLVEEMQATDLAQVIDTGNLQRLLAEEAFQPIESITLTQTLQPHLADLQQGWMGYALRSRIIYYQPEQVSQPPATYAELADSRFQGQLCLGAGTSLYNTSMVAAILEHEGEEATRAWIDGLLANLAEPAGGRDSEMLAKVAADNACQLTVANHYYFARFALSDDPEHQAITEQVRPQWPEQEGRGSLQNVIAFALLQSAENKESAIRFLEYLASDTAQQTVAEGIFLPVRATAKPSQAEVLMGSAQRDGLSLARVAQRVPEARLLVQEQGWE